MNLCSGIWKTSTLCSPILAQPSPCRTFRSDEDTTSSLDALLLAWTFWSLSRTTENHYQLFHAKPVHHKPYRFLKQLPIRLTLGIPSWWFLREAPSSSSYTSILVIVDHLSSVHSSSRLMTPLHPHNLCNYSFSTFSPSMAFQAMSLPIIAWNFYPTSSVPQNCIGHETSFHFQISSQRYRQTEQTNQTLEQYLWVYCNYQQDNCPKSSH